MDQLALSQSDLPVADENDRPPEVAAHPPQAVSVRSQIERRLVIVAFVALWMALGILLKLDANAYLLLGVPLTAGFQILVARRPIRALWVRDAPRIRVDRTWLLATGAFAALPLYELTQAYRGGWIVMGWYVCAILGAPAAAYAIQNWGHKTRRSVPVAVGMVVFVSALMSFMVVGRGVTTVLRGSVFVQAARWTLLYLPVCFMLEEVTFRGALDSYLWRPGEKKALYSAVELSFLWGLWHLPVVPIEGSLLSVALLLSCFHLLPGIPLSLSWRTGGNLLVPAAAHAAVDGVRNGLLMLIT
jgi:hypothetical protein